MNNLTSTIDRLGFLAAQSADIEKEIKALKATLIENGVGAYEGETFRATVSSCERSRLDMDAVREKLSTQFITAHTTFTQVVSVRVTSRNGKGV